MGVESTGSRPDFFSNRNAVAQKQTLVAAAIANDLDIGIKLSVALDQATDGGREAGREATSCE